MKYIIMEVVLNKDMTMEIPVIFPESVVHLFMATTTKSALEHQWPGSAVKAIRAGFISSTSFEGGCYGESETLKLQSAEEIDDRLISMSDYGSNIVC